MTAGGGGPEALNASGIRFLSDGRAREAESAFRELIRLRPNSAPAYANFGLALRLQNRGEEALDAFRHALALDPGQPENHLQLFKQLQQVGRPHEALECLEAARKSHPSSKTITEALALALGRAGQSDRAEALFEEVWRQDAEAANRYAGWLQEEGRFEDAASVLEASLRLKPIQGVAFRCLAEADRFEIEGERLLDKALAVAKDPGLTERERMHLAYGLGRAFDHEGDFQGAMSWFDVANAIAYRTYPACRTFDPAWTKREPELMAEIYTGGMFQRLEQAGFADDRPIFIVGMIRSGTTLLDQVLSLHPEVVSVGEGGFWNSESDALHPRWRRELPSRSELESLAERYIASVGVDPGAGRFTDKMPLNYRNLGPIHAVFPQAKVLHLRRDPFDTCLSIYKTFFAGGPNFAYSQENIVTFYRAYQRTMEHWRKTLPAGLFHDVDYESLVTEPERVIREVLAFLDLPWDDRCLRPETNRGQVFTPSRWQARRPIYATSIGKRELYGSYVGALTSLSSSARFPE